MNLAQMNNYTERLYSELFNPDNFPIVISKENVNGLINKRIDEHWLTYDDFLKTILRVASANGDNELIVMEDFERVFKSTGKTIRLHKTLPFDWDLLSNLLEVNDMISFLIFDKSCSWCAWFNENYWCLFCGDEQYELIDDEYKSLQSAKDAFPESDREFFDFIENLYVRR
ncbi:hypothetical protein [Shewanella baltica]|uniref:hypothetical protein n=1 Tax=Shewanella baltica TaxID=62322 RepID=UPI000E03A054|nr:hypothetical protein [Shewanella baltica]SUI78364.1 Uncharacterised protein [Shewanella baltica]